MSIFFKNVIALRSIESRLYIFYARNVNFISIFYLKKINK